MLLPCVILAVACNDGPSAPRVGSLIVNVSGLSESVQSAVTITGPAGGAASSRTVSATDTVENLTPGFYTVAGNSVTTPTGVYQSTTPSQQVEVKAGTSAASVTVSFQILTGSIALSVTGLPTGSAAAITVSGTGGYSRQVTGTELLSRLQPGPYVIASGGVTEGSGHVYSPTPIS
ncbi:MAG TPA: hypothetical protein VFZ73_07785, partial [Gemmatimonadaceae bacterium]